MALYVDQVVATARDIPDESGEYHSRWCHLLADTEPELHAAARRLGLRRDWYEEPDGDLGVRWHYLIPALKRAHAIRLGATELDRRGVADLIARRRAQRQAPTAEEGEVFLDWRDPRHFDHSGDRPCVLCGTLTPLRSHQGEAAHKTCAERWAAAHPGDGRFVSDADQPARRPSSRRRT